jgi:hypothetical protein
MPNRDIIRLQFHIRIVMIGAPNKSMEQPPHLSTVVDKPTPSQILYRAG